MADKYRCPECKWEGTENDMGADYITGDGDEMWSNWICKGCGMWWSLEDYNKI